MTNYKYATIANGLGFSFGALDDPIGKEGLHHFVEHLIFESNQNLKYLKKFQNEGVIYNGATSFEFILFYTQSLREKDSLSKKFFEQFLDNVELDGNKFSVEKKIVSEEIKHYLDDKFEFMIAKMLDSKNNTVPILGSVNSLNNIALTDIYDAIDKMKNNAIVVNSDQNVQEEKLIENKLYSPTINYDPVLYIIRNNIVTIGNIGYTLKVIFSKNDALLLSLSQFLPTITKKLRAQGLVYSANIQQINSTSKYILFFQILSDEQNLEKIRFTVSQLFRNYTFDFQSITTLMRKNEVKFKLKNDNPIGAMKSVFASKLENTHSNSTKEAIVSWSEGILINDGSNLYVE
ncbi:insulinase family protein [Leuconostoc citreum]|uniref:insulinase family protein n=1 Tax=Leuconostoc citreum TaxID=33964 RepID=UPI0021A7E937|nr:insulinase family protein [Leuconostoc citreum]MCT3070254.1 insulinase family protein [Leuconostoc citreum]